MNALKAKAASFFLSPFGERLAKVRRWDQFSAEILGRANGAKMFPPDVTSDRREVMYRWINDDVLKNESIHYMEFGVWQGDSISAWSRINTQPQSTFVGFDSFEGLPEEWTTGRAAGHFGVGGAVPVIPDERVTFVKGWFNKTLDGFLAGFERRQRMVLHLDADLYSSTIFVLITLNRFLRRGDVLMFDEFNDLNHEFAAFRDFIQATGHDYKILSARADFRYLAVELR